MVIAEMKRRDDIQWIRALAIIAVCGFHLMPEKIPFAYYGVDIFFVISGYLITVMLSKSPSLATFYFSRIKRIFPNFFLIITISICAAYFILLPSAYDFFKTEVFWSITFLNNLYPVFHKKKYFDMLADYNFLVHTWSLGVEIQFYLMAPFLIKFLLSRKTPLLWIFNISFVSFTLQFFIPDENISFGLVFCRIWQFLMGTAVYVWTEMKNDSSHEKTNDSKFDVLLKNETEETLLTESSSPKYTAISFTNKKDLTFLFAFFLLVSICFFPINLTSIKFFSIFICISCLSLTSLIISLNSSDFLRRLPVLNTFMVLIGDASYIIYLVHWPIIAFFKYLNLQFYFVPGAIVTISLILYYLFEKPMRYQSLKFNLSFIAFSLMITLFFCKLDVNQMNVTKVLNVQDAVLKNEVEGSLCNNKLYHNDCKQNALIEKYYTQRPPPECCTAYCSYQLNSNSEKTIMLTGNSFMFFQNRGILDAVKQSKTGFKEAFLLTQPSCSILLKNNDEKGCGSQYSTSMDALLDVIKPDYIIHSSRINGHFPTLETQFDENDQYYQQIKDGILHLASFTSRLIIVETTPFDNRPGSFNPYTVAHELFVNGTLQPKNITLESFHKYHNPSWFRVQKAVMNCSNCVIVPTQDLFCENGFCHFVDTVTHVSLYCDPTHLSPTGSLRLTPRIVKAIDEDSLVFNQMFNNVI